MVDAEERAEILESEKANLLEEHKAALFEAQRATAGRKDNSAWVICYLHKMNFLQYFHVLQLFEVGNLLHQVQQVAFGEHFSINLTLERDSHQNTAAF